MCWKVGRWSSISQHREEALREARLQSLIKESRSEGLLVWAEPLEMAERLCRRLVREVRVMDGALWLAVDLAWAGAINMVLVEGCEG
jgi:hypothetical protein